MGSQELSLLDIDRTAAAPGLDEQISLPAQERWYLQDVHNFSRAPDLVRPVDVGEQRQAGFALDGFEDAQALFDARSAVGFDAGAVRLVVRRFEDDWDAGALGGSLDCLRGGERVFTAFDDTGAADEGQWRAPPIVRGPMFSWGMGVCWGFRFVDSLLSRSVWDRPLTYVRGSMSVRLNFVAWRSLWRSCARAMRRPISSG